MVKPDSGALNVNLVLYTPDPGARGWLDVSIDRGAPARREGVPLGGWTLARRRLPLPAAAGPATLGFTDRAGGALWPHRVVVSLGDDLPAGAHSLTVSAGDTPGSWLRAFARGVAPPAAAHAFEYHLEESE